MNSHYFIRMSPILLIDNNIDYNHYMKLNQIKFKGIILRKRTESRKREESDEKHAAMQN